jgi:DNA helicase-2/ATP-dependent DNA helicase PcrA
LTYTTPWSIVPSMRFIADLHIHSHFSRATSRDLVPEHLALWARKKGITVVGTGDCTHPGWMSELQEKLVEAENGLYQLKPDLQKTVQSRIPVSCQGPARFLLSCEISCIYKRGGKTRKVHNLILLPDFETAFRLNERLERVGNVRSDGRPILGLDSRDLLEMVLSVSDRAFFIPAHIWTPWFSLFGSKSGFETIEECFDDLTPHIHALETGLSSDPPMNRCLSPLDDYLLVSNSDAHSPAKLGREANIFDTPLDYDLMVAAMAHQQGFEGTIEFFPQEGKYHFDGHRKCQVRLHPRETTGYEGICPACGKPLTIGVLHRIYTLSDRDTPQVFKNFHSLIPLPEILSEILGCGASSKRVLNLYEALLESLGPELHILMAAPVEDIEKAGGPVLAEAIRRMRRNKVICEEGYDGEYGTIHLFDPSEISALSGQIGLFCETPEKSPRKSERPPLEKIRSRKTVPAPAEEKRQISDPILGPLNAEQKQAVLYQGGHLLIVAGPGTGKTMTLTHRIAYQIHSGQAQPEQVLALTFTNKAAREMAKRLAALLSEAVSGRIRVGTFHSFCLEILRNEAPRVNRSPDFILCSELDAAMLAKEAFSEAKKSARDAARFLKALPQLKMARLNHAPRQDSDPIFQKYEDKLESLGMLDLYDLEVETVRLFRDHPDVCLTYSQRFPRMFVDEYQDTNALQAAFLKLLVHAGSELDPLETKASLENQSSLPYALGHEPCAPLLCAIGDPYQSIYGFRGAEVENFHRFAEDFPGAAQISLYENYRSTQTVLDGAAALLEKTEALRGQGQKGDFIRLAPCRTSAEEAEMVVEQVEKLIGGTSYFSLDSGRVSSHEDGENLSFGDIAVLFRLNTQGDDFEEAFSRAGIPFVRSGEKPLINRYPANVVWRFFQALRYREKPYYVNAYLELPEMQTQDGREILNAFVLGDSLPDLVDQALTVHRFDSLSDEATEALRRFKRISEAFGNDLASFLDALSLDRGIDHSAWIGDRVALMTLHAAKGLEWPVVFITGCEDKLIPCSLFGDRDDAEERRLFYVGMTRARSRLILSHVKRRTLNNRPLEGNPSPFIPFIPDALVRPLERGTWTAKKKPHKQLGLF